MFYNLILNMWIMATITAEQVQSKAPKYISQLQVEMILATPQAPIEPLKVSKIEQA